VIFASDLDQTLIYSERAIGDIAPADRVPVELYEGRHISFMSAAALGKLGEVAERMKFVPVTTRTPEQYGRIFGLRERFDPEYAIVSNGGTILRDGRADAEWNAVVRAAVSAHCAGHEEIFGHFNALASADWVKSSRLCDGLFYSIVIERDKLPLDELEGLKERIGRLGWSYSLQGRKIYLVPEKVSKGAALAYVKERLSMSYVFAAGDSLLDESLLLSADCAFAPAHGELRNCYRSHPHIRFTRNTGAAAAEELLDDIILLAEQREGLRR